MIPRLNSSSILLAAYNWSRNESNFEVLAIIGTLEGESLVRVRTPSTRSFQ